VRQPCVGVCSRKRTLPRAATYINPDRTTVNPIRNLSHSAAADGGFERGRVRTQIGDSALSMSALGSNNTHQRSGRTQPVPDGRPHISICQEAAVDEAAGAWRSEAAAGYSANVLQPHDLIPAANSGRECRREHPKMPVGRPANLLVLARYGPILFLDGPPRPHRHPRTGDNSAHAPL
jgi:hypothetical protein